MTEAGDDGSAAWRKKDKPGMIFENCIEHNVSRAQKRKRDVRGSPRRWRGARGPGEAYFATGKASDEGREGANIGYVTERPEEAGAARGGRGKLGVVKLIRAYGGCLGAKRRRRTRLAAKSFGEPQAGNDPEISEWGNPYRVISVYP